MSERDDLSELLHTWRHEPAPNAGFSSGVWTRIRAGVAPEPAARSAERVLPFSIPLPLAAAIAILLSSAAGFGTAAAVNRSRAQDEAAARYVQGIDPLQMTATHSHR